MDSYCAEMLDRLRGIALSVPAAGLIETIWESCLIDAAMTSELERFLGSSDEETRNSALSALVLSAHKTGYEADALALHYSGTRNDSDVALSGITYLIQMATLGSQIAARILKVLYEDTAWRAQYGTYFSYFEDLV